VGHGLPFWIAASLFVAVSIPVLQHPQRQAAGRRLDARALGLAGVIGLAAGLTATLVFQRLFLAHLAILNPTSILYGLAGALTGIIVGCLPGLSATLCIALLTTVTIKLPAND